ncbi:MAG: DUF397 domain-containing protein [Streptosporangiaceae bacterium]
MTIPESAHEGPRWRKPKYSTGNGECVEVARTHGTVDVRDSKRPDGPMLSYPAATWRSFLADAKLGDFDVLR